MNLYQEMIPHDEIKHIYKDICYCNRAKYIELYTKIYQFCIAISSNQSLNDDNVNKLVLDEYNKFENILKDELESKIKVLNDSKNILSDLIKIWNDFSLKLKIINNICEYYNKNFVCKLPDFNSVSFEYFDLGLINFNKILLTKYKSKIRDNIIDKLNSIRDLFVIDQVNLDLINNTLDIFKICEISDNCSTLNKLTKTYKLEKYILEATEIYYFHKSTDLINTLKDKIEYIDICKKWIEFDKSLKNKLNISKMNNTIIDTMYQDIFILSKFNIIRDSIIENIKNYNSKNLDKIYNFVKNHHKFILVYSQKLEEKILNVYNDEILNIEKYDDFVNVIKTNYQKFTKNNFYDNNTLSKHIDNSLTNIINKQKNTVQYIVKYFDYVIKNDINDDELIDIIKYIEDKDLFLKYYQHFLA